MKLGAMASEQQIEINATAMPQKPFDNNRQDRLKVIEKLGLQKCSAQKLQLQDALRIRPALLQLSLKKNSIKTLHQLPYLMLHRIISYDCNCRTDFMAEMESSDLSLAGDTKDDGDSEYYGDADDKD